jgi:hypothetical protein
VIEDEGEEAEDEVVIEAGDEDEDDLVHEEDVEEGFIQEPAAVSDDGEVAEGEKASLAGMVEDQLDEADQEEEEFVTERVDMDDYSEVSKSALDEDELFGNEGAEEVTAKTEIEEQAAGASREQMDSDFKQLLDLELDPHEFPQSVPPDAPDAEVDDESPTVVAEAGHLADGAGDDGEIIDELDEDFLDLLDEDIVEIEED